MADAGVRLVQDASEVAVVGIFEVLAHLPAIRHAMRRLEEVLESERPDLLVPVDFPDFNLRLAARARKAGVPVVYFVSPQVWAWRAGRVAKIRRLVRRVLVLFPFEVPFYEGADVPVTYVGHPAVERVPDEVDRSALLARAGLDPAGTTVALLPGSRRGEVERLLPPLLEAGRILGSRRPELQFLIPRARALPPGIFERAVEKSGLGRTRVHGESYPAVLSACDAGVVASGTATLDAALAGLPMVVVYRTGAFTYAIGRRFVDVPHVALANLVAGRRVVPELIQAQCTPDRIAAEIESYLGDPAHAARVRADLSEVRDRLGPKGAFDRAADAVLRELSPCVS